MPIALACYCAKCDRKLHTGKVPTNHIVVGVANPIAFYCPKCGHLKDGGRDMDEMIRLATVEIDVLVRNGEWARKAIERRKAKQGAAAS